MSNLKCCDAAKNTEDVFLYVGSTFFVFGVEMVQCLLPTRVKSLGEFNAQQRPSVGSTNFSHPTFFLFSRQNFDFFIEQTNQVKKLNYLNLENNLITSIGDLFINYLDLTYLKMSNNKLGKLPFFIISGINVISENQFL